MTKSNEEISKVIEVIGKYMKEDHIDV